MRDTRHVAALHILLSIFSLTFSYKYIDCPFAKYIFCCSDLGEFIKCKFFFSIIFDYSPFLIVQMYFIFLFSPFLLLLFYFIVLFHCLMFNKPYIGNIGHQSGLSGLPHGNATYNLNLKFIPVIKSSSLTNKYYNSIQRQGLFHFNFQLTNKI